MTVGESMVWFIGMAIAVLAILVIGTLGAAEIIRPPHRGSSRRKTSPERRTAPLGSSVTPGWTTDFPPPEPNPRKPSAEPDVGLAAQQSPPTDSGHGTSAA